MYKAISVIILAIIDFCKRVPECNGNTIGTDKIIKKVQRAFIEAVADETGTEPIEVVKILREEATQPKTSKHLQFISGIKQLLENY